MFKKTKSPESTLFESPSNLMRGRASKKYDDPEAWHNQFYELVTSNIDEDKFKPLFKSGNMGRGNASISQLLAIMIMKEGNREFAADNLIDFVTSGLQGKPSRYDLTLADGNLTVVDKTTGETVPATWVGDKWRIASKGKAKYRYFTQEQVEKAMLRKKLEAIPKKELDRRNNVEAAMFQISYHTRNGKTRYRGLAKHVMWACSRCMWMNFVRLMIFQTTTCQRTLFDLFGSFWRCLQGHLKQIRESLLAPRYIMSGWQTMLSEQMLPSPRKFVYF